MLDKNSRNVNMISALLFLGLSSLIFAWIFEWNRYYAFCDPMAHLMSGVDKALLLWFLAAKSVAWFLPFIGILWCLMALNLFRFSHIFLIIIWFFSFLIMTVDLSIFSIQGFHSWIYLELFFAGRMALAQQAFSQIWGLTGIKIIAATIFALATVSILGWVFFCVLKWIVTRVACRFEWSISRRSLIALTIGFVLFTLGLLPLPEQFRERAADALPLGASHKKFLLSLLRKCPAIFVFDEAASSPSAFSQFQHLNIREDERFLTQLVSDAVNHENDPAYSEVVLKGPNLPNVVLIIVESFRPDIVGLGRMKDLGEWAKQGLQLQRHYSGSNTTRPGLFSLLSGQVPLHQIRDSKIGFQMIDILKRSGYQTTFITYRDTANHMHMDDWSSLIPCDNFIQEGNYDFNIKNWADSDRRKMKHALHILNMSTDRPKFLMIFLLSSHIPYDFPPEFEIYKSQLSWWIWKLVNPNYKIQDLLNRYTNTMLFLESEIMQFIRQLDPSRNIIIVTGDHGESMKEDGVATHGSRPSEVQLRVPLIMVGPGVGRREISTATAHNDVLPTLLHAIAGEQIFNLNSSGRDLIADPMPADEVVLAPYEDTESQNILFIRKDTRLLFKLDASSDNSTKPEFVGKVDEAGQFKFKVNAGP